MQKPLLICDLDGTLVDSQPGIVEALRQACLATGVEPLQPLAKLPVGPPLDELLHSVTGLQSGQTFDRLRSAFTECYDRGACRLTVPFDGVPEMLESFQAEAVTLAIATNKRQLPTKSILEVLGWTEIFSAVESVDSRPFFRRTKTRMLCDVIDALGPPVAAYLGDTAADAAAAKDASVPCIFAAWGYGTLPPRATAVEAACPGDVVAACRSVLRLGE